MCRNISLRSDTSTDYVKTSACKLKPPSKPEPRTHSHFGLIGCAVGHRQLVAPRQRHTINGEIARRNHAVWSRWQIHFRLAPRHVPAKKCPTPLGHRANRSRRRICDGVSQRNVYIAFAVPTIHFHENSYLRIRKIRFAHRNRAMSIYKALKRCGYGSVCHALGYLPRTGR